MRLNRLDHLEVTCLPAIWHNHPERIPAGVTAKIKAGRRAGFGRILVAYGDCGTGGMLDALLQKEGVERLEGAHCYAFYAGIEAFDALQEAELGTFYLTDYLVRHFDRLIMKGLGLDRFPQLRDTYFGQYTRLLYLAQSQDAALDAKAGECAAKLGLPIERHFTGYGRLAPFLARGSGEERNAHG